MTRAKRALRIASALLLLTSMLVTPATAGRKHTDVEKIGQRDINGSVALIFPNFVSLEKEIQLGGEFAQQFEQTAKLVEDPVVNEYVDRIGQAIVKHSDAKVPFRIKVVDTDEVNAFALPGGYFYVNKGLILEAENEAELAGVMAHEISHVTARHATERMTKAQLIQFAALPLMFIGSPYGLGQVLIQNGLGLGISLAILGITRESEAEADQLGVQYLWNTGFDPNAFVTFFEKLEAKEKNKPGTFAGFFRTHPSPEDRIKRALQEQSFLPVKEEYVVTSSEFDRVKSRLVAIDNKLTPSGSSGSGGAKKPTLQRRTGTSDDGDGKEKPTLKKDRPTLKRDKDPDKDKQDPPIPPPLD